MVPGLDIMDAQPEGDHDLLVRLALFAARRWTPTAAVSGPDGLWLGLEGVAHLFGGERIMCERILRFCARLGLATRIAVAGTAGAAHAHARYGSERILICPNGREGEALAAFPLAALRVEEEVLGAARRLGIERIGDLISMPRGPLSRRFGKTLLARLDQALGWAAEPIDPVIPQEPPSACLRFAEPIATAEAIEQALEHLMTGFIATLEEQGLASKRTLLLCSRIDGEEQRIAVGTSRASRDGRHLLRLLVMKIETIEPGFGIEAIRLVADRFEPLGPQPVADLVDQDKAGDISDLIDRLAGRLGARRLYRLSAVESDVPERSLRRVGTLAETRDWPSWPRPARLLSPPEPIDHVVAVHPDGGPMRFNWRGKAYRSVASDGPERLYGEWWKNSGEASAVRDYFQVEDSEGARFWLYRKGDPDMPGTGDLSWYIHGVFG